MIDRNDDEAMARLRAADPATGSHPDLHSLRLQIAAKAPASQPDGADRVTSISDDLLRGPRVRAPWIAAAAVAALGIGAGGYAIGAQGGSTPPVAERPATDVRAGSDVRPGGGLLPGSPSEDEGSAGVREAGGDSAGPAPAGDSTVKQVSVYDPGPVRLAAGPGLPTERSTAPVSALTAPQGEEYLAEWAGRLGVNGRPVGPDQSYFPADSLVDVEEGKVVSVTRHEGQGPMSFSYEDIFGNPDCASMFEGLDEETRAAVEDEWRRAVGDDVALPDPSQCSPPQGERLSDDAAVAAAQEWLDLMELSFPDLTLEVSPYQDETTSGTFIEGQPQGDLAGQIYISINVGPEGVYSANGSYGELSPLGDYPVISAVEAVERYQERPFSSDYAVQLPEDGAMFAETLPAPEVELPTSEIEPGMAIPLLLQDKTVTEAELVQGFLWGPTGLSMQVPAWKLTTADGMYYPVLAVADESIDWVGWQ